ncbi:MAG: hypothetical protein MI724_04680 [Spirochaetales bacterium]|nr:hypothetical protein [Spirochaetales bacterium]
MESTYDRAGRLIRSGERTYTYDGVRNLTGETCRGVHTTYAYNGADRMITRRHNTGSLLGVCDEDRPNTVRTGYDALGRRVWRTEEPYSGVPHKATYLYDGRGFDLVGETDQDLSSRMVENDLEKDLADAGGRGRSRMGGGAMTMTGTTTGGAFGRA